MHEIFWNSLQRGDSSAPLGQSVWPSHTLSRSMHSWLVGQCHWPEGQLNGGVGQFCSSLMSRQSLLPSHNQSVGMHSLLAHWKLLVVQVTGGQELCSSDPSAQSGWPSHSHLSGMQKASLWHWNSSLWHRPGPRVAGGATDIKNYWNCSGLLSEMKKKTTTHQQKEKHWTPNQIKSILTIKLTELQVVQSVIFTSLAQLTWFILLYILYRWSELVAYDSLVHQNGPCSQTLRHTDNLKKHTGLHWHRQTQRRYRKILKVARRKIRGKR